jgi:hypothetical protein
MTGLCKMMELKGGIDTLGLEGPLRQNYRLMGLKSAFFLDSALLLTTPLCG